MFLGSFPLMLEVSRASSVFSEEKYFLKIQILLLCWVLSWLLKNGERMTLSSCFSAVMSGGAQHRLPAPYRAFQRFKENFHVQMLIDPQTGIVTNTRYPEQMLLPLRELPPKLMFVQTEESINCWFYLKIKPGFPEFCVNLQLAQFC